MQPGDMSMRGKATERQLSSLLRCQTSSRLRGTSPPFAVPGDPGDHRPGKPNTKPQCPTLTSQLVELLFGQGKDGLIQGDRRLLFSGLFLLSFCHPSAKRGLGQASAAHFPGVWPGCFQHLGFPVELPSQRWAACPGDNPWSCLR